MSELDRSSVKEDGKKWLQLGNITGVFGIKGWLKVYANTEDKENILSYQPWYIERNKVRQPVKLKAGKAHGKTIIVQLEGVDDRNEAETWIGCDIYIPSDQLKKLADDEYYWSDLVGLTVMSSEGQAYGVIERMLETGANDVMVVQGDRERLIPFAMDQVIKSIDLGEKKMVVDWDADF